MQKEKMEIPQNKELVQKIGKQNCKNIMKMEEEIGQNRKGDAQEKEKHYYGRGRDTKKLISQ